ncbi:hypothetical protein SAMN05192551_11617 [Tindallia magadiensis]|uniref:Uncharacterized protein n=1 Tax=Tindallia magadiensis TaxID=69895 RepID=A0A1I3HTX0_9FIRM|nr:hypothetical protein [Tindallia magadiensis]SFI39175.1 hypothetical protein SAMN05192551_11617 [Tindallia magadiensis]
MENTTKKESQKPTKRIWFSGMTIVLAIIQIVIPLVFGTTFALLSFLYFVITGLIVTVLINWSISWLKSKGRNTEAERYYKDAPITFQIWKFAIGIFVSMVIVFYNMVSPIDGIQNQILGIIISWYFVPLIMVFISSATVEVGMNEEGKIKDKFGKLPKFAIRLVLTFFDEDQFGKFKWGFKPVVSTIAFFLMMIMVALFYVGKVLG